MMSMGNDDSEEGSMRVVKPSRYPVEACDILQYQFKERQMNNHTIHFVASFSSELNPPLLQRAIALSTEAFPLIRCRFVSQGGRPQWEDAHISSEDMIQFSESENALEDAESFLGITLDESAGPQAQFGLFRQDGKDTLVVLMNHMLCDAAGFKDYLYMFCDIYTALENGTVPRPPVSDNRQIGQILRAFPCLDRMRIICGKDNMAKPDSARFGLEGDRANPFIEKRMIPRETFSRLITGAKSRGATVNDLMLTAYIRAIYPVVGRVIPIPCTVDLRKYLPEHKAAGFCNLTANLTCDIGDDLGDSLGQTLDKVKRVMTEEKNSATCVKSLFLLEKIFDILPYRTVKGVLNKVFSNPTIAFTNIGILDSTRLSFGSTNMENAYMTGSIKFSPYLQMAISTYENQATLSVNLYGTDDDRKMISGFLDSVLAEFRMA
jgi:NRPS condensation-like uncharacterized protein